MVEETVKKLIFCPCFSHLREELTKSMHRFTPSPTSPTHFALKGFMTQQAGERSCCLTTKITIHYNERQIRKWQESNDRKILFLSFFLRKCPGIGRRRCLLNTSSLTNYSYFMYPHGSDFKTGRTMSVPGKVSGVRLLPVRRSFHVPRGTVRASVRTQHGIYCETVVKPKVVW